MTRTTSELAPPPQTSALHQRLATTYDLACNRPHTRRIFSGIGFRACDPPVPRSRTLPIGHPGGVDCIKIELKRQMKGEMFPFYLAWPNKELRKYAHLILCLSPLSGVKSFKRAGLWILKRSVRCTHHKSIINNFKTFINYKQQENADYQTPESIGKYLKKYYFCVKRLNLTLQYL
ncbi:hypothetical protein AVEN_41024-1 [Araneus ventricosus]|uniref:Uncharacterized protein n=1 Tax=Araneus ventricosus TaxID=182803 RepID=A0A4Y2CJU3_ARAVE|nr:hypothetical protein AVEN_41024-1 [Araneus ventricosus]